MKPDDKSGKGVDNMAIVILGGGPAAVSAIEGIRQQNRDQPVILVSAEKYYPYYRLRLSFLLGQEFEVEKFYLKPPSWYTELGVEVRLGVAATAIRPEQQLVELADGSQLHYSALIIATGSRAFLPPVEGNDLPGVFTLRQVEDALKINEYARPGARAVIIGGGPLGLEAAWTLSQRGVEVTVLEHNPRLLPRQVDEGASGYLHRAAAAAGIRLELAAGAQAIKGTERVEALLLADGRELPADLILFSTGVRPNLELASAAGINCQRGIVVDEYMWTSIPGILACGDVAEYRGQVWGLWPVAQAQGKVAGSNAAGAEVKYEDVPPPAVLRVMGTSVFSIGNWAAADTIRRVQEDGKSFYCKLCFNDRRLTAAIVIGDEALARQLKRAVETGREADPEADFTRILKDLGQA